MATIYYTGRGDDGTTGLLAEGRLGKEDILVEALGDLDELNSAIGIAVAYVKDGQVKMQLGMIQNDIFILGANLAAVANTKMQKRQLGDEPVQRLERDMKGFGDMAPELKEFVLPGGSEAGAHLHLARAVCRRAERKLVAASRKYAVGKDAIAYLNRLSSYLFAAARYSNAKDEASEAHPTY